MVDEAAGSSSSSSDDTADTKLQAAADGTSPGSTHAGGGVLPAKQPAADQSHGVAADEDGNGSTSEAGGAEHHGMVLPFTSVTLTFRDVHYSVPAEVRIPRDWSVGGHAVSFLHMWIGFPYVFQSAATSQHNFLLILITALLQGGRDLELLKGITGAFRPGVLTALMGEVLSPVPVTALSASTTVHTRTASKWPWRLLMYQQSARLAASNDGTDTAHAFIPGALSCGRIMYQRAAGLPSPNADNGGLQTAGASGAGKTTFMVRSHALPVQADLGSSVPRPLTDRVDVQWWGFDHSCLQDVLAGRKTAGRTTGTIRVNGHPQDHRTFARVSGCEYGTSASMIPCAAACC